MYLSQYFKWYIIYFSMIFLNEGIVVLNSIPFTRVFDVSFRCVAVDFDEELWRRGEKKKVMQKAARCEGKVDIYKLQTARCVFLCALTSAHRPYNGTHLLFYLISCVEKGEL